MISFRSYLIIIPFLLCAAHGALAAPPVIFYSDITSGPGYGGEAGAGVFITLNGNHFGDEQGDSYVTVGGPRAARYIHWSDSKIIFQPGRQAGRGFIQVYTAAGGVSNGAGFQPRRGRIFFVDGSTANGPGRGTFTRPWKSPASFYRVMRPGDTCYIRKGVYAGKYGSRTAHANVGFGAEAPNASSGNEIVWSAYPNEEVSFEALQADLDGCFEWKEPKDHYVIAGFILRSSGRGCLSVSGRHNRIVNNDCVGTADFSYALIFLNECVFADVFGNRLHGLYSGNKLSHPLYIGGEGRDINFGWNMIFDNGVAEGPLVLINQDNAKQRGARFTDIQIHDNFIDGAPAKGLASRGIGFADQAYGSTAVVYNNIITHCSKAMYALSGNVKFLNNTVYGCSGPSAVHIYSHFGYVPENIQIMNNIFDIDSGCGYIDVEGSAKADIGFNAYSGNGKGPSDDANAVAGDPGFVNAAEGDFRLKRGSPLIGAGSMAVAAIVSRDYAGIERHAGRMTVGAFEYRETNEKEIRVPEGWSR